jgi:hypothetical protein
MLHQSNLSPSIWCHCRPNYHRRWLFLEPLAPSSTSASNCCVNTILSVPTFLTSSLALSEAPSCTQLISRSIFQIGAVVLDPLLPQPVYFENTVAKRRAGFPPVGLGKRLIDFAKMFLNNGTLAAMIPSMTSAFLFAFSVCMHQDFSKPHLRPQCHLSQWCRRKSPSSRLRFEQIRELHQITQRGKNTDSPGKREIKLA